MACSALHLEQQLFSCILVPTFRYVMREVIILNEICGFRDITRLLYNINGAEHLSLEISLKSLIICTF